MCSLLFLFTLIHYTWLNVHVVYLLVLIVAILIGLKPVELEQLWLR